jgi:hypothetical protein
VCSGGKAQDIVSPDGFLETNVLSRVRREEEAQDMIRVHSFFFFGGNTFNVSDERQKKIDREMLLYP